MAETETETVLRKLVSVVKQNARVWSAFYSYCFYTHTHTIELMYFYFFLNNKYCTFEFFSLSQLARRSFVIILIFNDFSRLYQQLVPVFFKFIKEKRGKILMKIRHRKWGWWPPDPLHWSIKFECGKFWFRFVFKFSYDI